MSSSLFIIIETGVRSTCSGINDNQPLQRAYSIKLARLVTPWIENLAIKLATCFSTAFGVR
ncbi:hypothetical protein [Photobacterium leiognathi]|uniref:hypothetical protein n=1 Tax=Photobacterium leiognathi TaxID=553611 RepID=UPI002739EBD8|nr:hypothetical protein [Photobacterium leiognathi]